MGGAEAIFTGLNHLDKFAWIGSFSGAFVMWRSADRRRRPGRGGRSVEQPAVFEKTFPSLDARSILPSGCCGSPAERLMD
jgi:enterochelin esterase-like enzyme